MARHKHIISTCRYIHGLTPPEIQVATSGLLGRGGPLLPCTLNLKWLLRSIITHVHPCLAGASPAQSLVLAAVAAHCAACLSVLYSGAGLCYACLLVTHLPKGLRYNNNHHHSTHFTSPHLSLPPPPLSSHLPSSSGASPGTTNSPRFS